MVKKVIVLDVETTGLDCINDRIIEVGCVEVIDGTSIGKIYNTYVYPERLSLSEEVRRITGLTIEMLKTHPTFAQIAQELFEFIGDNDIVAHNAKFDVSFLNEERKRMQLSLLQNATIDTLQLARQKRPNSPANLDSLCDALGIDRKHRQKHGALIDAKLTAYVYIALHKDQELTNLFTPITTAIPNNIETNRVTRNLPGCSITNDEIQKHKTMIQKIPNCLWNKYEN